MIVRLLFAIAAAAVVSVVLWASASALIEPAPFVGSDATAEQASRVQLCVDCDGEVLGPPPPPPPCEWPCPEPPPFPIIDYDPNPTTPLVTVAPTDFDQCTPPATVEVDLIVPPEGGLATVSIRSSTDQCFNRPSLRAAEKWVFGPAESGLDRRVSHTFRYE